jgi:hypothetical protein
MKATIQAIDPGGCRVEFTTEDYKTPELLDTLPKIKEYLLARGYTLPAHQLEGLAGQAGPAFAARELVPDIVGGTVYWRVLGGPPRHKYGCRVWPETLRAAGLDPSQARKHDLTGWLAFYELRGKKDSDGQKEVVTRLAPPGPADRAPQPESELDVWFPRPTR